MRYLMIAVALSCCLVGGAADNGALEKTILDPIASLRKNDIIGWFKALPAEKQQEAEKGWKAAAANPNDDASMDQTLALLNTPNAVDTLMMMVEPKLQEFNAAETAAGINMFGGVLAMSLSKDPANAEMAQAFQLLVQDLAAWLPKAGINDPAKARAAIEAFVQGVQGYQVTTAAELRALSLDQLLERSGTMLKQIKSALAVYDLQVDKALESVKVGKVEGDGDKRTATIQFNAFGRDHSMPVKMMLKDGAWVADAEAMGLDNNGMLGGGPEEQAPLTLPSP